MSQNRLVVHKGPGQVAVGTIDYPKPEITAEDVLLVQECDICSVPSNIACGRCPMCGMVA
jgi:hypothetical protein